MAELTATARTGLHRYHFPQHQAGHLLLDLSHGMQDNPTTPPRLREVELSIVDPCTLLGGRRVYQWAKGRYIFFAMRLSRPFARAQLYSNDAPLTAGTRQVQGVCLKAALHFPDAGEAPLLVKVGLSAVSAANALANLDAELPDFDFARVHAEAVAAWENALGRARIATDNPVQRRIFTPVCTTVCWRPRCSVMLMGATAVWISRCIRCQLATTITVPTLYGTPTARCIRC